MKRAELLPIGHDSITILRQSVPLLRRTIPLIERSADKRDEPMQLKREQVHFQCLVDSGTVTGFVETAMPKISRIQCLANPPPARGIPSLNPSFDLASGEVG